jgi:hypothetical protein
LNLSQEDLTVDGAGSDLNDSKLDLKKSADGSPTLKSITKRSATPTKSNQFFSQTKFRLRNDIPESPWKPIHKETVSTADILAEELSAASPLPKESQVSRQGSLNGGDLHSSTNENLGDVNTHALSKEGRPVREGHVLQEHVFSDDVRESGTGSRLHWSPPGDSSLNSSETDRYHQYDNQSKRGSHPNYSRQNSFNRSNQENQGYQRNSYNRSSSDYLGENRTSARPSMENQGENRPSYNRQGQDFQGNARYSYNREGQRDNQKDYQRDNRNSYPRPNSENYEGSNWENRNNYVRPGNQNDNRGRKPYDKNFRGNSNSQNVDSWEPPRLSSKRSSATQGAEGSETSEHLIQDPRVGDDENLEQSQVPLVESQAKGPENLNHQQKKGFVGSSTKSGNDLKLARSSVPVAPGPSKSRSPSRKSYQRKKGPNSEQEEIPNASLVLNADIKAKESNGLYFLLLHGSFYLGIHANVSF